MMFTCAMPGCTDPHHDRLHGPISRDAPPPRGAPLPRHATAKAARAAASTKVVRDRGGKSLRVDIHCHYLNQAVAAKVAHLNPSQYEPSVTFANALTREVNVKQIRDRLPKLSNIETRLKDMDRMGIDIQAVSPAPNQCYYWTEPELGLELSRMVNNRLAEIVATWPERFVALGTVPLQQVDLAVAELERCVKELGLRGVEINPSVNGMDLTDARLKLEKFFARAQALDVVIFMHPIGFTQGERLVDHYFNNVIGNPMETTIAASHLIFDGVMQRHPKLKIVLPHAGGYLAHYWARMDHGYRARPDCRTVIKRPPSSYLAKMYFDSITFDLGMLRHMIDRFGPGHVLLGTDYPYDMGEENPLALIGSVRGLKRAEKDLIEGGNAARLLKIKR
ncbi:MAG TPA: amidohydrolase family protein [Casimicrobiaceae bacterium]|nr:amidohydrolase family protein [Casimicrobiaceae bacterium]